MGANRTAVDLWEAGLEATSQDFDQATQGSTSLVAWVPCGTPAVTSSVVPVWWNMTLLVSPQGNAPGPLVKQLGPRKLLGAKCRCDPKEPLRQPGKDEPS